MTQSFTRKLRQEEWIKKADSLIEQAGLKCEQCNNSDLLKNTSVGFLVKSWEKGYSVSVATLPRDNHPGFSRIIIQNRKHRYQSEFDRFVYFPSNIELDFDDNLAYVIYYEDRGGNPDQLVAISQLDILPEIEPWDHDLEEDIFPFKSDSFIRSSNFILNRRLYIHFKEYIDGTLPWEYPNSKLICLCWKCLKNYIAVNKVKHLDLKGRDIELLTPCRRCLAQGYFAEYNEINSGLCFQCEGHRYREIRNKSDELDEFPYR